MCTCHKQILVHRLSSVQKRKAGIFVKKIFRIMFARGEAKAKTFPFGGKGIQSLFQGIAFYFLLGSLSQRKHKTRKLLLGQSVKHIGLVLPFILRHGKGEITVSVNDLCVMARRNCVTMQLLSLAYQGGNLDKTVAYRTYVRGSRIQIRIVKITDNRIVKQRGHVRRMQFYSVTTATLPQLSNILLRFMHTDVQSHNMAGAFTQKQSRRQTVHPSAQPDKNPRSHDVLSNPIRLSCRTDFPPPCGCPRPF